MKRGCKTSRSSDTLTGGSGDVNPQVLQFIQSHDFANSLGSQGFVDTFPNPVWDLNRSIQLGCDKNKAFAMEVLAVDMINDGPPLASSLTTAMSASSLTALSYDAAPSPALPVGSGYVQTWEWVMDAVRGTAQNDTNVLATQGDSTQVAIAGGPLASPYTIGPTWDRVDLTDGQGHGVLVGSAVFNIRTALRFSTTPSATGTIITGCRILYRVKAISYEEWVRQFTFGV